MAEKKPGAKLRVAPGAKPDLTRKLRDQLENHVKPAADGVLAALQMHPKTRSVATALRVLTASVPGCHHKSTIRKLKEVRDALNTESLPEDQINKLHSRRDALIDVLCDED